MKNEIGNKPSEYFPDLPLGSTVDKNNITITQDPTKPGSVDVHVPIYDKDGNKTEEVIHLSGFKPNASLSGNTNPAKDAATKLEAAVSGLSDANRPTKYPQEIIDDTEILQNVKNEIATNPDKYFPNLPEGSHINKGDIVLTSNPSKPNGVDVQIPITLPNGIVETPTIHLDGFKPGTNKPTTPKPSKEMQQVIKDTIIANGNTLVKDKLEANPSLLDKIQSDLNNAVQTGDLANQLFDGLNANGHHSTVSFGKPEINADGDLQVPIIVDGWFDGKNFVDGHTETVVIPTLRPAKDPDTSKPITLPHGLSDVTVIPNSGNDGYQSLDSSSLTQQQITDIIKQEIANSFSPAGSIKPDQIHISNANSNIWDGTASLDVTVDNWVDADGNIVPSHSVTGITITGFKPAKTELKPNAEVKVPGFGPLSPETLVDSNGNIPADRKQQIITSILAQGLIQGLDPTASINDIEIVSYDPATSLAVIKVINHKGGKDGASVESIELGSVKISGFKPKYGFGQNENYLIWWLLIASSSLCLLVLIILLIIYARKCQKAYIDNYEQEMEF